MIIDSHCHLDFDAFEADRDQVMERARGIGIDTIIVPGVTRQQWPHQQQVCDTYPETRAAYGLHPYFLEQHRERHLGDLHQWVDMTHPIGIGECGLDFYLKDLDRDAQMAYFTPQLDLALEVDLPVIIHARKSTEAVIIELKKRPGIRGMVHSYSGSYEQAMQLVELGFFMSFGGAITSDRASRLRSIVSRIPLENLLLETDAPDQPDDMHTGQRNEPAYITRCIEVLAQLQQVSQETIIETTAQNTRGLFRIPPA